MKDGYGREIDYLRISVTDRCNLRCLYCMPEDIVTVPMKDILTFEEIVQTVRSASELGISKIKITGGEPLVRRNVCHLIGQLKEIPGIDQVTLTTNGILLQQFMDELEAAGTDVINISLDTLDRSLYQRITGYDALDSVIGGLELAVKRGIPVKINAVSADWKRVFGEPTAEEGSAVSEDMKALIGLAEENPVDVRFIELMPIGYGKRFPGISHDQLILRIRDMYGGIKKVSRQGNGPAVYYSIPGYRGSIGFISAIHGKFCDGCNRIRLTSKGYLKSCLCYNTGVDIKEILRGEEAGSRKSEALNRALKQCILSKPASHSFNQQEKITEKMAMSAIGG